MSCFEHSLYKEKLKGKNTLEMFIKVNEKSKSCAALFSISNLSTMHFYQTKVKASLVPAWMVASTVLSSPGLQPGYLNNIRDA